MLLIIAQATQNPVGNRSQNLPLSIASIPQCAVKPVRPTVRARLNGCQKEPVAAKNPDGGETRSNQINLITLIFSPDWIGLALALERPLGIIEPTKSNRRELDAIGQDKIVKS